MNHFNCSNGERVTESQIKNRYTAALRRKYEFQIRRCCVGCGKEACCTAHIIARSRCKQIGKTELIWNADNMFESCYACNAAIENPKGAAWKELHNKEQCLEFIEIHDSELFAKFLVNT